jgi:ADP-ribose pyrophosphatase YjhB (NUDIX family)
VSTVDPVVDETVVADGWPYRARWFDPPFRPPLEQTTQALGACFTVDGAIVLVTENGSDWTLPGGAVERGETLEQTLARKVREEACARVLDCSYLGCQLVDELEFEAVSYYQTRFWARVELEPWVAEHEMVARRTVDPAEFLDVLSWGRATTAAMILDRALKLDRGGQR